jgi:hypothetical protein
MRRFLLVAVMSAAIGSLTVPGVSEAQSVTEDSVVGFARDCAFPDPCPADPEVLTTFTALTANARSSGTGQAPSGTMAWNERIPGDFVVYTAQVTCLSVSGNAAIVGVGGTRTSTRFGFSVPVAGLIRVTDGGSTPGRDTFEFDISLGPLPPPTPPPPLPGPTECTNFPSGRLAFTNEEGDLVVTDAQAFPTTKDQCKNGGWRNYGVFTNQGDCVRFVRHQARQECVFIRAAQGRPAFRARYGAGLHKRHAMRRCIRERMND